MKLFALLLLGMLSGAGYAESKPANSLDVSTHIFENTSTGELVIGIPNFNMKRYDEFIKTVTSINGIRNIEYCSGVEVFLIQYDTTVFGSSEEAFRALESKLNGFKIFHKRGPSHAELKGNC